MLKRLGLWLSTSLFTIAVLILSLVATVLLLANPPHVKKWLSSSGIYSSLPNSLLTEVQKKQAKSPDAAETNFNEPAVQMAAKAALSPQFLQTSGDSIVDSSFAWLNKQEPVPSFTIDLKTAKQTFADKLAEYLKNRYEKLPACTTGTAPRSTEPFTIDCQPAPGFDVNSIIDIEKEKLLNNADFLPDNTLSAQNFGTAQGGKNIFERLEVLPKAYSALKLAPFVLAGLAFVSSLGILFLSESKKQGARKIGWRLTILGALSLAASAISTVAIMKIRSLATSQNDTAVVSIYKDALAKALNAIRNDILIISGVIAAVLLVFGVFLIVLTRNKQDKQPSEAGNDDLAEDEAQSEQTKPLSSQNNEATKVAAVPKTVDTPPTAPIPPKPMAPSPTKPASKPKPRLIQ